MKIKTSIKNFFIDNESECLKGKIKTPKFNLGGAKIFVKEYPGIEGYVVELFSIIDPIHGESRATGIEFEIDDWYVRINIYDGWKYFTNGNVKDFSLVERDAKKWPTDDLKSQNSESFLLQLKNVSGRFFPNFYLDIRGGEKSGAGRNEHGSAHFHIRESGTKKDLGKVFFPMVQDYELNKTKLVFSDDCQINRKSKKLIVSWVFDSDLKNLRDINKEWTLRNRFNNRTY